MFIFHKYGDFSSFETPNEGNIETNNEACNYLIFKLFNFLYNL